MDNGTATAISYTIAKSVPADAKFTDTTYESFTGATASTDGEEGLVLAPNAGDQDKYLRGDGTWTDLATTGNLIPFGTSSSAASATQKEVSIPEVTVLRPGQLILVQADTTSTVANSTLKLNDFDPYPMRYANAAICLAAE